MTRKFVGRRAGPLFLLRPAELQPEELVHRAIEHGDKHTIKVTEAYLREHRIRREPPIAPLQPRCFTARPHWVEGCVAGDDRLLEIEKTEPSPVFCA
jgi:hypothetical protein